LNLNVRVNENVMSVLLLSLALALYFVAQLAGGSKLPCFSIVLNSLAPRRLVIIGISKGDNQG
jgi:hypothetical protein